MRAWVWVSGGGEEVIVRAEVNRQREDKVEEEKKDNESEQKQQ
jgi:hypothetical protein